MENEEPTGSRKKQESSGVRHPMRLIFSYHAFPLFFHGRTYGGRGMCMPEATALSCPITMLLAGLLPQ